MAWFELTGSNPTDPQHYTLRTAEPSCLGNDQICAIQATTGPNNKPVLSDSLKNDMINALNDREANDNVLLKSL